MCVHRGTIYPVGQFWEEACDVCTCTDLEDSVMGLRVAQCSQKPCEDNCLSVRGAEGAGHCLEQARERVGEWGFWEGARDPLSNFWFRARDEGKERTEVG